MALSPGAELPGALERPCDPGERGGRPGSVPSWGPRLGVGLGAWPPAFTGSQRQLGPGPQVSVEAGWRPHGAAGLGAWAPRALRCPHTAVSLLLSGADSPPPARELAWGGGPQEGGTAGGARALEAALQVGGLRPLPEGRPDGAWPPRRVAVAPRPQPRHRLRSVSSDQVSGHSHLGRALGTLIPFSFWPFECPLLSPK